jgi:hypothetical protein
MDGHDTLVFGVIKEIRQCHDYEEIKVENVSKHAFPDQLPANVHPKNTTENAVT